MSSKIKITRKNGNWVVKARKGSLVISGTIKHTKYIKSVCDQIHKSLLSVN